MRVKRQRLRFERVLAEPVRHRSTAGRARLSWLAASLLLLVMLAGGMGLLAQSSLPGDVLYPVKLLTEDLRLAVVPDPQGLQNEFAARRFDEARQLVQLQRPADLTLTGRVDAVTADSLTMQGLTLLLPDHDVLPGSRVAAQVRSTNMGTLVVRELRILETPEPARQSPAVIPESTPTRPRPTTTPRPTDRPRPTRTVESRPTVSPDARAASPTPERARNAADACPAAPADWTTYTIQPGDTLSDLAVATDSSVDDLLAANCLTDVRHIVAGQSLSVPRPPQRRSTVAPTPSVEDITPTRGDDAATRSAEQNRQRQEEGDSQQRESSPQRETDEGEREQRGR
jgi:LysM repeat protein